MNNIEPRVDVSTLNNNSRATQMRVLKAQRDNLANLVNLGLISNNLASEHGIWQGYRGIIDNTTTNSLPSKELTSAGLPSVKGAIEAYKSSLDDAMKFGLIEDSFEEKSEAIYKKSL